VARAARRATGPELRLERERYAPGDTVRGVVKLDRGTVGEIEVSLNFHERSTEYEATPISIPALPAEQTGLGSDGHRFAIELPEDAPPTLEARHGALWWTVDATVGGPDAPAVLSRRVEIRSAAPTGPGSAGAGDPGAGRPPRR
jgi:hypothetical protein